MKRMYKVVYCNFDQLEETLNIWLKAGWELDQAINRSIDFDLALVLRSF